MRRSIKFLLSLSVAFMALSCSKDNGGDISHRKKSEAFMDKYRWGAMNGSLQQYRKTASDTSVLITGVEFPDGYDWRRDSLYGNVEGKIILIRNGIRALEIAAGGPAHASLSPDKHFLIQGHVYTEFYNKGKTIIGCDGEDMFSIPGRQSIRGLAVEGQDTFILFQNPDGKNLTLTRNGMTVLQRENAMVVGEMSSNHEYPSGSLYFDSGHLYFAYWRPVLTGSGEKAWFIVEDGRDTQIEVGPEKSYDIRIKNGEIVKKVLAGTNGARFEYSQNGLMSTVIAYHDGTLLISNRFIKYSQFTEDRYYFFSFRNAFMVCPTLYLAVTPQEEGAAPVLWKNGAVTELDFNGFVTAIEASVLPGQNTGFIRHD